MVADDRLRAREGVDETDRNAVGGARLRRCRHEGERHGGIANIMETSPVHIILVNAGSPAGEPVCASPENF
jgi:hypothetical protein